MHLKDLLRDSERNKAFVTKYQDIIFDYSHEKMTLETVQKHLQFIVDKYNLF